METLIEILEGIRPDIDFQKEAQLISGGILTSVDVIAIMDAIELELDIVIRPKYMTAENFNSAASIWKLIERLSEYKGWFMKQELLMEIADSFIPLKPAPPGSLRSASQTGYRPKGSCIPESIKRKPK